MCHHALQFAAAFESQLSARLSSRSASAYFSKNTTLPPRAGKGLFPRILLGHPPSKGSQGESQAGQELMQRSAVYWLAPRACPACFRTPGTTCPVVAPPTVVWALPYQSLIKKMHRRLAHRPVWWGIFSSDDSSLCQGDLKASQHTKDENV